MKGPKPAVVFGKIGREGWRGSGNTVDKARGGGGRGRGGKNRASLHAKGGTQGTLPQIKDIGKCEVLVNYPVRNRMLYRGDKMCSDEFKIFRVVIIFVVDGIRTLE